MFHVESIEGVFDRETGVPAPNRQANAEPHHIPYIWAASQPVRVEHYKSSLAKRSLMKDCRQFYIDGKWVSPTTAEISKSSTLPTRSPSRPSRWEVRRM